MSNHANIIIDIETLSQDTSKGIVLDFAATYFDFDKVESFSNIINDPARSFYSKLDVSEQREKGRTTEEGTINWWMEQDKEVIKRTLPSKEDQTIDEFLYSFKDWLDKVPKYNPKTAIFYCRGQSFDFPFLKSLILDSTSFMKDNNIDPRFWPCSFWNQRDTRSILCTLWGNTRITKGVLHKSEINLFQKHNSLHDIARDIVSLQALWDPDSIENFDEYTVDGH